MVIIGLYGVTRELMTKTFSWLSVLSELAMPFYLTHLQILVMVAAGASWQPLLSEHRQQFMAFYCPYEFTSTFDNVQQASDLKFFFIGSLATIFQKLNSI